MGKCESCTPCTCPAEPCPCKADRKERCPKSTCADMAKLPAFCRFTMIVIDKGVVRFKWIDVEGGQHETRMTEEQFERWGREKESGKCGCCQGCVCTKDNCRCAKSTGKKAD